MFALLGTSGNRFGTDVLADDVAGGEIHLSRNRDIVILSGLYKFVYLIRSSYEV